MVDSENFQLVLGYPECKNAKPLNEYAKNPCPVCGGKVQIRKSKAGKKYYICENNKGVDEGCNYISWNVPQIGEKFDPNSVKTATSQEKSSQKSTSKKKSTKKTTKTSKTTKKKTTKK